ncbi:short-chain dehydrogenase [Shewanella colwelliana]|uniref:Short-chain dehydrogenase n=1 Tax=Shewanella colwelliana TaxID=23 RepID=A0A1E5INH4_SHECO|nr:NnrS family protein [Shewanella colwelliana]OEG72027.1 short-chain dehydrogenase [Shewanella colwelliana]
MLNIDEPSDRQPNWPFLRLGFRPFFLLGTLFSIVAMGLWGSFFLGQMSFTPHGNPLWWHGHEMIYGFVMAIVAGFILTASQTWTGQPSIKGKALGLLVLLWLIPRVLLIQRQWFPFELVASIDLLFAPLVAWILGKQVIVVKQWRNFAFIPIFLLLSIANALSYYGVLTRDLALVTQAFHGASILMVTIVALIGGRVVPFFTDRATTWQRVESLAWLEKLTFISLILLFAANIIGNALAIQIMAMIAGTTLLFRWSRWGVQSTLRVPLLWSLHLSYLFIPVGLLLMATGLNFSAGLHAMTVGGLGGMILAMMARVSLGHTGRNLVPPKTMVLGFGLILIAATSRVLAALLPQQFSLWLAIAILSWILAFASFFICYMPILVKPRIDGRPG